MDSLWTKTAHLPHFPPLEGDRETDVLIIGGGMAGILCAWFLNQVGVDYILLEAAELCGGTTGNTTAKITAQHELLYDRLIRTLGQEKASLYLRANQAALEQYRRLCRDIDCDFQTRDSFVFSLDRRDKLERETLALTTLGVSAEFVTQLPLPFSTVGAVCFPRQAQFHPLKFAAALVQGLHIHEHTKVLELRLGTARTHQGTVRAQKIVVTTRFPLLNKHGGYFIKLYQHRSSVLAL